MLCHRRSSPKAGQSRPGMTGETGRQRKRQDRQMTVPWEAHHITRKKLLRPWVPVGSFASISQMGRPETRRRGPPVGVSLDLQLQGAGANVLLSWGLRHCGGSRWKPIVSSQRGQSVSQPWMLSSWGCGGGVFMGKRTKVQCDVWFWLKALVMPRQLEEILLLERMARAGAQGMGGWASAGEAKPNTQRRSRPD